MIHIFKQVKSMKLFKLCTCLMLVCASLMPFNVTMANAEEELDLNAPSAILIEPISGAVLYEKNADEVLYPASMTKMMGMYLVLEAIENHKIAWDDQVIVSTYASSMGGTQIFLEPNESMSVEDLFKAVAVNSANDAIVALGEFVAGSNDAFINMMNDKAREFEMTNTNFANATGFDDPNHVTCVRDMARIGAKLLTFGEQILRFSRLEEAYVREDTESPFWLVNTNKLLKYYDGLDGLKTGFTKKAGYNLTATAKRNGLRLLSVVMKEETIQKRSQDTIRLLDYGFSKLEMKTIFNENDTLTMYNFNNTLSRNTSLITKKRIDVIVDKGEDLQSLKLKIELFRDYAPIDEEEIIGELVVETYAGRQYRYPVYVKEALEGLNFWDYLLYNLGLLFA